MIGIISLGTLTLEARCFHRWLSFPGVLATALVPIATIAVTFFFYRSLRQTKDAQPFFWALALFGLCLIGLGISIWPNVIPARYDDLGSGGTIPQPGLHADRRVDNGPHYCSLHGMVLFGSRGKVGHDGYH